MFKVSRPSEAVMLNCCVTDTKFAPVEDFHNPGEVKEQPRQAVHLVHHHTVSPGRCRCRRAIAAALDAPYCRR